MRARKAAYYAGDRAAFGEERLCNDARLSLIGDCKEWIKYEPMKPLSFSRGHSPAARYPIISHVGEAVILPGVQHVVCPTCVGAAQ